MKFKTKQELGEADIDELTERLLYLARLSESEMRGFGDEAIGIVKELKSRGTPPKMLPNVNHTRIRHTHLATIRRKVEEICDFHMV